MASRRHILRCENAAPWSAAIGLSVDHSHRAERPVATPFNVSFGTPRFRARVRQTRWSVAFPVRTPSAQFFLCKDELIPCSAA